MHTAVSLDGQGEDENAEVEVKKAGEDEDENENAKVKEASEDEEDDMEGASEVEFVETPVELLKKEMKKWFMDPRWVEGLIDC